MRIRGGVAKGQIIRAPKGYDTRPTSDKVKEAIFNVLAGKIFEADVLDLCAGSGNLGLEALSRGAKSAIFVENHPKACHEIVENTKKIGFDNISRLHKIDALKSLSYFKANNVKFDIIFFDPPYHAGLYEPVLGSIADAEADLLNKNGVLIVECSNKEELPDRVKELAMQKISVYGDTKVIYYQF